MLFIYLYRGDLYSDLYFRPAENLAPLTMHHGRCHWSRALLLLRQNSVAATTILT